MASTSPDAASPPGESQTFTLQIISPSVAVPQPLNFTNLPATNTVRQLKERIRDAIDSKPGGQAQRLIHRGRLLARDDDTMLDIFGAEMVRIATPNITGAISWIPQLHIHRADMLTMLQDTFRRTSNSASRCTRPCRCPPSQYTNTTKSEPERNTHSQSANRYSSTSASTAAPVSKLGSAFTAAATTPRRSAAKSTLWLSTASGSGTERPRAAGKYPARLQPTAVPAAR